MIHKIFIIIITLFFCSFNPSIAAEGKWISLFNGQNLDGWDVKITGHKMGVNYKNTFRAKDGILSVNYDEYDIFDNDFGHIFYNQIFSNYILKLEYRIRGQQVKGGPAWGIRNNGIMVHSQSAQSMELEQYFPRSIEVQLLGGDETGETANGNVCTPGTHIIMDGALITEHCINSNSVTNRGEEWVSVEVEVKANEIIRHKINGVLVMEYSNPQIDAHDVETPVKDLEHLSPLSDGYIALQAESHGFDFRNIMLLNLDEK